MALIWIEKERQSKLITLKGDIHIGEVLAIIGSIGVRIEQEEEVLVIICETNTKATQVKKELCRRMPHAGHEVNPCFKSLVPTHTIINGELYTVQ